jgi:UDP-N-acetylmuramyl pentapeptide synthase
MAAALNVLGNRQGRKIAVLGDMLELGDCADEEHFRLGRTAAAKADLIFAYGPHGNRVVAGAAGAGMENAFAFDSHDTLAEQLKKAVQPGDVLLFKGSRGMHMEISLEKFLDQEK